MKWLTCALPVFIAGSRKRPISCRKSRKWEEDNDRISFGMPAVRNGRRRKRPVFGGEHCHRSQRRRYSIIRFGVCPAGYPRGLSLFQIRTAEADRDGRRICRGIGEGAERLRVADCDRERAAAVACRARIGSAVSGGRIRKGLGTVFLLGLAGRVAAPAQPRSE